MKANQHPDASYPSWRRRLYEIIFDADKKAGKLFDIVLLILIVLFVVVICFESYVESTVPELNEGLEIAAIPLPQRTYLTTTLAIEWVPTVLFTIEYVARIISDRYPSRYIFSFFGIIDLLSILPTYANHSFGRGNSLVVFRAIRLVKDFRVLKLVWVLSEANETGTAIWQARGKLVVFFSVVVIAVTIAGAIMHELEPQTFDTIPKAIYLTIVTMTTVGFGDLVPQTGLGQAFSWLLILLGCSLIIVPTDFVSAEFVKSERRKQVTTRVSAGCMTEGHENDTRSCKYCSHELS